MIINFQTYNVNQFKPRTNYNTNTISKQKTDNRDNYGTNLPFYGNSVYVLDGGQHADDVYYFAKAIDKDFDLTTVPLELNKSNPKLKQLKSLRDNLAAINGLPQEAKPDYIAIPLGSHVSLLNLSDQASKILGRQVRLTPDNVSVCSEGSQILHALEILSKYPNDNRHYINRLDPLGQGIEYTYDVIKEINKAVASGIKVYVPAGHPIENSVKWVARDKNLKPEYYHYISTGNDVNNTVGKVKNFVKDSNWYDFNLLSLSNATSVALRDKSNNPHLYTAYDSCVKAGARGVYNFTPIRQNGEVKGFSFTDEKTIEYPIDAYKMRKNIDNLLQYVGRNINEVKASYDEINNFRSCLNGDWRFRREDFAGKLFPVEEVFSPDEIRNQRIYLQGDYTDNERKLFFNTRSDGTILFNKCNYEKSDKPSVVSMWGCCFSIFNVIKEDIENNK